MNVKKIICYVSALLMLTGCAKQSYRSNGERIYKTGRNEKGERLLDKEQSRITFIKSCKGCHGRHGDLDRSCVITWSSLTDPEKRNVPYNEKLFFRFLDKDLHSDGSPVSTGVHWNISDQDKQDLIMYLKTL